MINSLSLKLSYAFSFSFSFGGLSLVMLVFWLFDIFHEINHAAIKLTAAWSLVVALGSYWMARQNLWGAEWPVRFFRCLVPLAFLPLFIPNLDPQAKTLTFLFQASMTLFAWRCHKWLRAVAAEEFDHLWPEYRAQKVREKAAKERLKRRRRGLRK